jgi:CrcB protein
MSWSTLLYVAVGGALGAASRYVVSVAAVRWVGASFSWGTLIVNLMGCFLVGYGFTMGIRRGGLTPHARLLLMTGLLGALTTFSTYSIETFQFVVDRRYGLAATSVVANNVGGFVMTALGMWLGRF